MPDTIDTIYGRDAIVLYLRDIRDLETMLKLFERSATEGDDALYAARQRLLTPNKVPVPTQGILSTIGSGYLLYLFIAFAVCLVGIVISLFTHEIPAADTVSAILMIVLLSFIEFVIYNHLNESRTAFRTAREDAIRHNERDERRLTKNRAAFPDQYQKPWLKKRAFLEEASKRIAIARNQCYSLNIIPLQYRNLEAVQYLYDFMSTSYQPFSQALDHAQIENGIRRIEDKLDEVIGQNESQLRKLARIESDADTIKRQGYAILAAQVATAFYASSAAAHSKAIDAKLDCMQSYMQYGF